METCTAAREAPAVSAPAAPLNSAFLPAVPAPPARATTADVAAAAGEAAPPTVEDAGIASSPVVQATPPVAELPRISSSVPASTLDIPTLASIEMSGGLDLSLFAVLFGVLGSAALGLHLLLRRIESTL